MISNQFDHKLIYAGLKFSIL